jgi:hypothetical protein
MRPMLWCAFVTILLLACVSAHAAGTVRVGMQDDPDALDPALGGTFAGRIVFASLCDKLIDLIPLALVVDSSRSQKIECFERDDTHSRSRFLGPMVLVTNWILSRSLRPHGPGRPTSRTLTLTLRDGVIF